MCIGVRLYYHNTTRVYTKPTVVIAWLASYPLTTLNIHSWCSLVTQLRHSVIKLAAVVQYFNLEAQLVEEEEDEDEFDEDAMSMIFRCLALYLAANKTFQAISL